jgi:hypothetical protein
VGAVRAESAPGTRGSVATPRTISCDAGALVKTRHWGWLQGDTARQVWNGGGGEQREGGRCHGGAVKQEEHQHQRKKSTPPRDTRQAVLNDEAGPAKEETQVRSWTFCCRVLSTIRRGGGGSSIVILHSMARNTAKRNYGWGRGRLRSHRQRHKQVKANGCPRMPAMYRKVGRRTHTCTLRTAHTHTHTRTHAHTHTRARSSLPEARM